jgi:serine/threonine protein kinase
VSIGETSGQGGPAVEPVAEDDPLIGQVLGDAYRITRLIGVGGMGAVYEAAHLRLPKRFAIKCLHKELTRNQDAFLRFQREAELATSLGNRHIVEVLDFNILPDGSPYMVMEYLDGEGLAARLERQGRLEPREALDICSQVVSALSAAHKQNVVHRDLKPDNIFICPGDEGEFVKLLDFGVSKIRGDTDQNLTGDLAMLGTPSYMSPEQARGDAKAVDHRADVYALGAVVYEMLTGQLAFGGETVYEVVTKIATQMPPLMHVVVPGLPPAVDAVVRQALAKDPAERPESAADFLRELTAAFEGDEAPAVAVAAGAVDDLDRHPADLEGVPTSISVAPVPPVEESPYASAAPAAADPSTFAPPGYQLPTLEVEPQALDVHTAIMPSPFGAETSVDQRVTDRMPAVRRSWVGLIVTVLVTVVAAVLGVWLWLTPNPVPLAPAGVDAAPAAAPTGTATPKPALAEEPDSPAAVADADDAAPKVRLKLKVTPAGARVLLDGEPVKGTEVVTSRSAIPRRFEASAPKYQTQTVSVVPSEDRVVRIDLKRPRQKAARPKGPPPRPRTIVVPPRP